MAEGRGISGRDDLRLAVRLESTRPAFPTGSEPRRISGTKSSTNFEVQLSKCREFVASQCGAVGAVAGELLSSAVRATSSCSPFSAQAVSLKIRQSLSAPIQQSPVVGVEWLSRLCVLMNPILPGSRSIRTWPAKCLNLRLLPAASFGRGARGKLVYPVPGKRFDRHGQGTSS